MNKVYSFIVSLFFIFSCIWTATASVSVTAATGGTGISADLAANACGTPAYTTLGNIVISEAVKTDFPGSATNATIVLDAPTNWQFNVGVGSAGFSGPDLTAASVAVTATQLTITWSTDGGSNNLTDQITISGIQVQAIDGSIQPSSGNITCSSMTGTSVVGITVGVTNFGSLSLSAGENMSYVSSTVTQTNLNPVYKGDIKTQVIGIEIVTCKWSSPLSVTLLSFADQSSNVSDLSNARLYYTGTSSSFANTNQVGTTTSPSGSFSFTPNTALTSGTNYFWLTYDVSGSATCDPNYIDANLVSLEINSVPPSPSPTVTNPSGNKKIHCKTPYYSQGDLAIDNLANWNSVRDGSGSAPLSFDNGYVLVIQSGDDMTTSTEATLTNFVVENGGSISFTKNTTLNELFVSTGATINNTGSPTSGLLTSPDIPLSGVTDLFDQGSNTDEKLQILYKASELVADGFSAGDITSISFFVSFGWKSSTQPFNNFTIKMKHSSQSNLDTPESGGFTTVWTGNHSTLVGDNAFALSTPFSWNGSNNLAVEVCWDNAALNINDAIDKDAGFTYNCENYVKATSGSGCSLTPATPGGTRPSTGFSINGTAPDITVKENFINSGTFNASSGKVIFGGTSNQKIQGNSTTTFNNIEIANATGVTLESPITIGGTMTFTNGDFISDATNIITFNDGSSHSGAANGSHINGHCKRIYPATGTFTFPVGDGTNYTSLVINLTGGTPDATDYVRASVSNGTHPQYTLASHINRYWTFTDDGTMAGNSPVYNWQGTYVNGDVAGTESEITAKKWSGSWESGKVAETDGANVLSQDGATTFSDGGGEGGGPMPIELLSFEAEESNKGEVKLRWETATEINNDYFTVERSGSGIEYDFVVRVKGAGNSSQLLKYSTTDYDPLSGTSYYRLKQTDYDGSYEYADIISINRGEIRNKELEVYPNPIYTMSDLSINMRNFEGSKDILVVLTNVLGEIIYSKFIVTNAEGSAYVTIQVGSEIKQGVYFVTGSSDQLVFNRTIVVH